MGQGHDPDLALGFQVDDGVGEVLDRSAPFLSLEPRPGLWMLRNESEKPLDGPLEVRFSPVAAPRVPSPGIFVFIESLRNKEDRPPMHPPSERLAV